MSEDIKTFHVGCYRYSQQLTKEKKYFQEVNILTFPETFNKCQL